MVSAENKNDHCWKIGLQVRRNNQLILRKALLLLWNTWMIVKAGQDVVCGSCWTCSSLPTALSSLFMFSCFDNSHWTLLYNTKSKIEKWKLELWQRKNKNITHCTCYKNREAYFKKCQKENVQQQKNGLLYVVGQWQQAKSYCSWPKDLTA